MEKNRSGEGYKEISNSLIIPLSTVKSIIMKWKTYHTTQTRSRLGCPSKLSSWASRKLVQDVTVNPAMTLKHLQGSIIWDGGQCSINNIPSPSQNWPLNRWQERSHYWSLNLKCYIWRKPNTAHHPVNAIHTVKHHASCYGTVFHQQGLASLSG